MAGRDGVPRPRALQARRAGVAPARYSPKGPSASAQLAKRTGASGRGQSPRSAAARAAALAGHARLTDPSESGGDSADDAAYSLNDIVDGVRTGFLSVERIEAWADGAVGDAAGLRLLDELLDAVRTDRLESIFSARIGSFITACRLRERDGFMAERTNRYRYELVVAPDALRQVAFYKQLANDVIFESPQLQQMEHKARKVLFDLWDSCWSHYVAPGKRVVRILPPAVGRLVDGAKGRAAKARQICDYLAGLTDGMIVRTYRRLFGPEFGSLRDLG